MKPSPLAMKIPRPSRKRHATAAFTLMEILVVVAIILVLAAIAFPVYSSIQMRANNAVALNNMKQLAAALGTYSAQNNGVMPEEDAKGPDSWQAAALPENAKAWYNCLPRLLGQKGVGEFSLTPRDFYSKQNILFLPGARYPESDRKLVNPLFAIAMNTKIQRTDEDGKKRTPKITQITNPARTVLFLEQGLPGEEKGAAVQSKKEFDGSPKGSAKSMAGRYRGAGVLVFFDGHAEVVQVKDLLTETGRFHYPQTDIVWTRTPEEDANK